MVLVSQFLSVSFEHAHPSADEIRIAAYRCAMDAGEKGVCLVQAKVLDHAAPINVVVNIAAGEATVVLSLPKQIHAFPFGWAYYFESGVYLVTEQPAEAVSKDVRSSVSDTDPLYLLQQGNVRDKALPQYSPRISSSNTAKRSGRTGKAARMGTVISTFCYTRTEHRKRPSRFVFRDSRRRSAFSFQPRHIAGQG